MLSSLYIMLGEKITKFQKNESNTNNIDKNQAHNMKD